MSFVAEFANIPRDKLLLDLYSCTAQDVERALVNPAGIYAAYWPCYHLRLNLILKPWRSNLRRLRGSDLARILACIYRYMSRICALMNVITVVLA